MIVSGRNMLMCAAALLAGVALSNAAYADGMSGGGSSGDGANACCEGGMTSTVRTPDIRIGGPGVAVVAPVVGHPGASYAIAGGDAGARGRLFAGRGGGVDVIAVGGYLGCCDDGPSVSNLSGLKVVSDVVETVSEQVPVTVNQAVERVRTIDGLMKVSAVCLDDTGTPHPASRPSPDEEVAAGYSGEIFRCMAGTAMQVTVTPHDAGTADHADARSLMCVKGEALRHAAGGALSCATQEPRRNCNERSLLRKYGPGYKIVRMQRTETYVAHEAVTTYQTVTRDVTRTESEVLGPIVLDGGVGAAACLGC